MASDKKLQISKFLQVAYLCLFALGLGIAVGNDLFHSPKFSVFKIPTYLKEVGPLLGLPWPLSFDIYHELLLVFALIGSLNVYGVLHVRQNYWRIAAKFSSFLGLFVAFFVFLFFAYPFFLKINLTAENIQTALIYSTLGLVFLIIDALTFLVVYQ